MVLQASESLEKLFAHFGKITETSLLSQKEYRCHIYACDTLLEAIFLTVVLSWVKE